MVRRPKTTLKTILAAAVAVGLAAGVLAVSGGPMADSSRADRPVIPLDSRMHYGVSWAGIHCGSMTLESFAEPAGDGTLYHIVMTARTSKFFDGIYRVRSRIESVFSESMMSSVTYHETSEEKKKTKDSLWEVDHPNGRVIHTENGQREEISISSQQVYDPLAFIYRVRLLVSDLGDQAVLTMVTSDGDVETVAEVVERKRISTPFGKRDAIRIVPRPKDEMLFSKKGSMSIWIGTDETMILYRVEFDLSFGKLVAKLKSVGEEASE